MIDEGVFGDITSKEEKETKGEPKRYVMFTLKHWQETINKVFGRDVQAKEIKTILLRLCSDELSLIPTRRLKELQAYEAAAKKAA